LYALLVAYMNNFQFSSFVFYYGVPMIVFGWWLVTVTYLQHHAPGTHAYTDENWNFVTGAFEIIDRRYGFGIDAFHHRISDCHVIHHLFFTRIPHYHLRQATDALVVYLEKTGNGHLYQCEDTPDFFLRVFYYWYTYGLKFLKPEADAVKTNKKVD